MTGAVEKLINENKHLALMTASMFYGTVPPRGLELSDLAGAALMGLCVAAHEFDPARGFKFSTYAIGRIRWAIREEYRAWDYLPRSMRDKSRNQGEAPPAPMQYPGSDFAESVKDDCDGPEQILTDRAAMSVLRLIVNRLPKKERYVLKSYYWMGLTQSEIAAIMNISASRVQQLRIAGLNRIKGDGRFMEAFL